MVADGKNKCLFDGKNSYLFSYLTNAVEKVNQKLAAMD
jgi:hypothetical protein